MFGARPYSKCATSVNLFFSAKNLKEFPVGHPHSQMGKWAPDSRAGERRARICSGHSTPGRSDLSPRCLSGWRIWERLVELVVSRGEAPSWLGRALQARETAPRRSSGTGLVRWLGQLATLAGKGCSHCHHPPQNFSPKRSCVPARPCSCAPSSSLTHPSPLLSMRLQGFKQKMCCHFK